MMYDLSTIPPIENMKYYFIRQGVSCDWKVYDTFELIDSDKTDKTAIATYDELTEQCYDVNNRLFNITKDVDAEGIKAAFELFKSTRPEYEVGKRRDEDYLDNSDEAAIEDRGYLFDKILTGAIILQTFYKYHRHLDAGITLAEKCLNWLRSTDFYIAPASTRYHESEPGGLLKHTIKVLCQMYELMRVKAFRDVNVDEAVVVALAHDWCKIGTYEQYMKNVKDEATGAWNKVPAYKRKDAEIPFGHGVASMFIAQKFMNLTTAQVLAIRWHMGRWYVADSDIGDLQHSNEKYPLVHLIQFADQLAITDYAK